MTDHIVQVGKPAEITGEDLRRAYLLAQLRRIGISYQKAIMTPCINKALHCTAQEMKTHKHGNPAPIQQAF
ncbi:MAG: hypothetical protein HKM00_09605 [Gallionella sp.]|nr:hypothetical protein [Gallionella sp.]